MTPKRYLTRFIAATVSIGWLAVASAPAAMAQDPSFLTVGTGIYDVNDNEDAGEIRMEYRSAAKYWLFKPFAGAMVSTDAAFYGYGGVLVDLHFGRRFVLTPSFAAGLYADGDGKDLGHVVEFRSGIEVAWRLNNRARIGLMFYHISNAGLDDNNPGTEGLSLSYSHPLN